MEFQDKSAGLAADRRVENVLVMRVVAALQHGTVTRRASPSLPGDWLGRETNPREARLSSAGSANRAPD